MTLPSRSQPRRSSATHWLALLMVTLGLYVQLCTSHAVRSTTRNYPRLSDSSVPALASLSDPAVLLDTTNPQSLLSQILIPRPPDTENSRKVRAAILSVFQKQLGGTHTASADYKSSTKKLGWHLEEHTFTVKTPEGKKKMTNLILTKNPAAPRKLVVAAHYDSKYFSASSGMSGFVGATDSAAPCAMMVDLAVALDDALDAKERKIHTEEQSKPSISQETTLQLVFFDGEEAYRVWTHEDSIYGSKELASHWGKTFWDAAKYDPSRANSGSAGAEMQKRRYKSTYGPIEHMNTIEHMILLDLLGAPNPTVPSYFDSTKWFHTALQESESRLKDANVLYPSNYPNAKNARSFFSNNRPWGGIEDDHLPFLHAGVPILHIIPSPFPSVWHKMSDDVKALDYPTMHAWCMIFRLAVAEYLGLDIAGTGKVRRSVETDGVDGGRATVAYW